VQAGILRGAATVVRPGGRLVYATCTLEPEENEGVVDSFLSDHPDFSPDVEGAILRVVPGTISADGAFAARLRRLR
jgi:16S rRNA (cytosine967-C5)-methyltransferase